MQDKQEILVKKANKYRGQARAFEVGAAVYVRTVRNEKVNWQPGIINKVISPVTYLVKVEGRIRFVHADHLRSNPSGQDDDDDIVIQFPRELYEKAQKVVTLQMTPEKTSDHDSSPTISRPISSPRLVSPRQSPQQRNNSMEPEVPSLRRSQRSRRVPPRMDM
ncbi:uncharacterized protein LOC128993023 [Macrosteles quadrilineatus]|uniref:uncharacterized protein LOC128993023 n=1 Tax=Macrosteles quadrilineatus TaxID=74068 RepID=UPI0023E29284|nr:uncharacterized protein LOC128993023 [Macrosteles quadrilineatus]